jgi:hypothetical protein
MWSTDVQTDGPTGISKTIYPLFAEGGIIYNIYIILVLLYKRHLHNEEEKLNVKVCFTEL